MRAKGMMRKSKVKRQSVPILTDLIPDLSGPSGTRTKSNFMFADKRLNTAIKQLARAIRRTDAARKDLYYRKNVYTFVWELVEAAMDWEDVHKLGNAEYHAEIERRRKIGLTIDPARAETTFWWADVFDPYWLRPRKYHGRCVGREEFARNPGTEEWVNFADLPEKTRDELWQRDGRKLTFPYGLDPDDDIINYPLTKSRRSSRPDTPKVVARYGPF